MSKSTSEVPADKLELYEKLVATLPNVERKGATVPYTSVNGHMFSYLSKTGTLALRLPAEARDAFLKKYKTTLCKQYGIVQKEYVEVPDALLKKTSRLKPFFAKSFAYVSSLKPKAKKKAE
jgi:hypothetical protein